MLVFSVSLQDMCDLLKRHIVLIRELHGALIPKHHLMVHSVFPRRGMATRCPMQHGWMSRESATEDGVEELPSELL